MILIGQLCSVAIAADDLEVALHELRLQVLSRERPLSDAVDAYEALTEDFHAPEEVGRIYAALVEIYATHGDSQPEKTIEFAKEALARPLEPLSRMQTCVRLGDGMRRQSHQNEKGGPLPSRTEVATPYLQGLRVAVEQDLPDQLEDIPRPFGLRGGGSLYEKRREENERRMQAWKARKKKEAMMEVRETLERQLLSLYSDTPEDIKELRSLAEKYLIESPAVDKLIVKERTKAYDRPPLAVRSGN